MATRSLYKRKEKHTSRALAICRSQSTLAQSQEMELEESRRSWQQLLPIGNGVISCRFSCSIGVSGCCICCMGPYPPAPLVKLSDTLAYLDWKHASMHHLGLHLRDETTTVENTIGTATGLAPAEADADGS